MAEYLVRWRDEFRLGVPDVDEEHRALIDLMNALYAALRREGASRTVGDFLGDLATRIGAHFALEERLMREAGYAGYAEHKADHERLLDDISGLMDDFEDGRWVDLDAFAQRLEAWFTVHFQTFDARLHQALGH